MSKEMPMVSIIIPCFNYARFLSEAIDSALGQTYEECEVIVVDDGSTDNSAEVAQKYGKSIRYLYQENQGHSAARNTGIRMARGEFVVFLDADDVLQPRMVATSMNTMNRVGEDFGIVACKFSMIDQDGNYLAKTSGFPAEDCEITALDLLIKNRFPPTILARIQIFDECGVWDEQLLGSEDRDMWLRTALKFRIFRSSEELFFMRRHGGNISGNGVMMAKAIKRVQQKAMDAGVLTGWEKIYRLKAKSFYLYQKGMMSALQRPFRSYFNVAASIALWPVFIDVKALGEKRWFRLKMMGWILSQYVRGKWQGYLTG